VHVEFSGDAYHLLLTGEFRTEYLPTEEEVFYQCLVCKSTYREGDFGGCEAHSWYPAPNGSSGQPERPHSRPDDMHWRQIGKPPGGV